MKMAETETMVEARGPPVDRPEPSVGEPSIAEVSNGAGDSSPPRPGTPRPATPKAAVVEASPAAKEEVINAEKVGVALFDLDHTIIDTNSSWHWLQHEVNNGKVGLSMLMTAMVPWQEVVSDMNDAVKNASAGYASFNYEEAGHKEASLQKVEIAVNGEPCDPLSFVCHTSQAASKGRTAAAKLKSVLSRQNFEIILQAKVGAKVLARERIAPYRKDVLTKGGKTVGGGDISRKKKLLEKQKAGKKKAKMIGKVEISQDAFWSVLSNSK